MSYSTDFNKNIALVEGIKAGEENAYRFLYELYSNRLYKFGLSYLKDEDEAADLVQTIFVKVYDNRLSLADESNIKSYLFKVAVNTIYDIVRKKKHQYSYIDYAQEKEELNSDDTWNQVKANEIKDRYKKVLDTMPEKRRQIFILSREEGKSNKEIAEHLEISQRTVENQIFRALKHLKQYLKDDEFIVALFILSFFIR